MKKVLAIVLALCMVFAMGTVSFAAYTADNITQDPAGDDGIANTVVVKVLPKKGEATLKDTYAITIPADVEADWDTPAVELPVKVTGKWTAGKKLNIKAEAGAVEPAGFLTMTVNAEDTLKTIDAATIAAGTVNYSTTIDIAGYATAPYDTYQVTVTYTAELA